MKRPAQTIILLALLCVSCGAGQRHWNRFFDRERNEWVSTWGHAPRLEISNARKTSLAINPKDFEWRAMPESVSAQLLAALKQEPARHKAFCTQFQDSEYMKLIRVMGDTNAFPMVVFPNGEVCIGKTSFFFHPLGWNSEGI